MVHRASLAGPRAAQSANRPARGPGGCTAATRDIPAQAGTPMKRAQTVLLDALEPTATSQGPPSPARAPDAPQSTTTSSGGKPLKPTDE